MASTEFYCRHFNLPPIKEDPGVSSEGKSYEELVVGLPSNNLTIVGLARMLADQVKRDALSSDSSAREAERSKLKQIVRYHAATLDRVWTTGINKHRGI